VKAGWELLRLNEVVKIVSGGTPKTGEPSYWGGSMPWLTPKDMGKQKTIFAKSTLRSITQHGLDNSSTKLIPENSVIISTRAPIGYLTLNEVAMAFNQGCRGLIPSTKITQKFLYYFLLGNVSLLNELGTGTTFKELSAKSLGSVFVPVPPLPEQIRIVEVLDAAFAKIDRLVAIAKRQIENTNEIYQQQLAHMLTFNSADFKTGSLGEFCIVERGSSPRPIKEFITDSKDGVNWVKIGDTKGVEKYVHKTKQKITPIGAQKSRLVEPGDFILTNSMSYGRPYIMATTGYIHDGWFVLRLGNDLSADFFYYLLSSKIVQDQFSSLAAGSVVKNISGDLVKQTQLSIPPIRQQLSMVEEIEKLKSLTNRVRNLNEKKIEFLSELRRSLLQKAFAGELVDISNNASTPALIFIPANDNHTDHAGVIAYADSYFRSTHAQTFKGKTTYEKVVQAAESIAGIELGRQAIQWKRGPTDNQQREAVEALAAKEGYFSFVSTGGKGFKLERGHKFNELRLAFERKFQEHIHALDRFLRVIANMDTRDVEVLSTVHTAWNNYIIEGQTPDDEQIVTAARENWHEEKMQIERPKFFAAIKTLRDKDLVPTGQGKYVGKSAGASFDF